MAQQLIVEGNDAIPIGNLLKIRGLSHPKGYETKEKYRDEFVISAGGYSKALIALEEAIDNPNLINIGLVIDANNLGPIARWDSIKSMIASKGFSHLLNGIELTESGITMQFPKSSTIGIWIMPDNESNGYLEHFLTNLIDQEDPLWTHVQQTVNALEAKKIQLFSSTKEQKAKIHTWLAWQKEPGKPFGVALQSGYLNAKSPSADNFEQWFRNTFELSE